MTWESVLTWRGPQERGQGQHPGQPAVAHGAVRQQPGGAGGREDAGLPGGEETGRGPPLLHVAQVSADVLVTGFRDRFLLLLLLPPRWPNGKASASRAEDPGFESRLCRDFFRGRVIPVTQKLALQSLPCQAPGVIGVSSGTCRPGVSILWLGEVESWICSFYLGVAAREIVWADPSLRYTSLLLGR